MRTKLNALALIPFTVVLFALNWPVQSAEPTNIFPILPWNNPPDDPLVLKKIHDCGFTLVGFVPPSALDHCREAGLLAIVSDARASGYDWTAVDQAKARMNVSNLVV